MAEGRERAEWNRTGELWALTANINRDPRRRRQPFTADDINPYRESHASGPGGGMPLTKKSLHELKGFFTKQGKRKAR